MRLLGGFTASLVGFGTMRLTGAPRLQASAGP